MLHLGYIGVIAFGTFCFYRKYYSEKHRHSHHVEKLKNALLSYALLTVYKNKIAAHCLYHQYDGKYLPPPSGYEAIQSCFNYIMMKDTGIWQKQIVIDDFIQSHITSEDDARVFFSQFLKSTIKQ